MLDFINKRINKHAADQLEARAIINDLESSKQAFRQAANTIIVSSAIVVELAIIEHELITRNRAQK